MRMPRIDHPGARHHVMNRGARRATVFPDDAARRLFLELLADLPGRFGVRVHGYALMSNHYHLLLESVRGELPRAMRHVGSEYTRRVNQFQGWDGPLFRGRYHNRVVGTETYWRHLLTYVHLNPVRAGLTSADEAAWTSHRAYLGDEEPPDWLTVDELRGLYGTPAAYRAYYRDVLADRVEPPDGFDPDDLWSPHTTNTVDIPDAHAPVVEPAQALAQVIEVTQVPWEALAQSQRGPGGNRARWMAAWWMSRHHGIVHGRIGVLLNWGHSSVSRAIRRVEERLDQAPFAGWHQALLEVDRRRRTSGS